MTTSLPLRSKYLLTVVVLSIPFFVAAQSPASPAGGPQAEINEQVWKPFIKGLNNADTDLFLSVHSKDLVRSPRDGKEVFGWDEYYKQSKVANTNRKSDGTALDIQLRFTERIAQGNKSIEVGIYKTTVTRKGEAPQSFYGRFHVVERKENGKWKILVDTDSSEGDTIGEEHFLAAKPME